MPLAAAAALLQGCFLFHGTGDPPRPTPGPDAGGPIPVGPDAGRPPPPRRDAGIPPPPPPGCVPRALDFACTDTGNGAVPVGAPYALPIALGGDGACFCGEQLECTAAIVGPGQLALRTVMCAEILCDGCFPFVQATCALPPLEEGVWHVTVNDRDALELTVSDATPGVGPVDVCSTRAPDASTSCAPVWSPLAEPVDQLCVPGVAPPGTPIAVELTDFCLGCGMSVGSCDVIRTANDLRVVPRSLPPSCDIDCGAECSLAESRCVIPPLEEGEYTLHVDGLPGVLTLAIDEGVPPGPGRSCLSIPED